MNKTKKILTVSIIIVLAFIILFVYVYSFNQAKKLAKDQAIANQIQADLESARQKLDQENMRLREMRVNSYFGKVSEAQYLKTKKLIAELDVFFKNPESNHPEIILKTKNKIIETEINSRRLKITEIMDAWADNNARSLETEQKLINEIKTILLIIKAYLEQLQSIVAGQTAGNSGLTAEQINSYNNIIKTSTAELKEIVTVIAEAEVIINNDSANGTDDEELDEQIEVVREAEETVNNLQNQLNNPPATTTPNVIPQTGTSTASSTVNPPPNTGTTTKIRTRPRIVNPEPSIIYTPNPAPYKDNGVDVNYSAEISPAQDW